jgi:hypothetical protein
LNKIEADEIKNKERGKGGKGASSLANPLVELLWLQRLAHVLKDFATGRFNQRFNEPYGFRREFGPIPNKNSVA